MKFITSFSAFFIITISSAFSQIDLPLTLNKLAKERNTNDRIDLYSSIFYYYQYSKPDSALFYVQKGINEFSEKNAKPGIAAMTVLLAFLDGSEGRLEMAREKQLNALAIYQEIGMKKGIAITHAGLGVIDGKMGNFKEATNHFIIALKNYEAIHDSDGIASVYLKIGVVNEKSDLLDNAMEYYDKTLHLLDINANIKTVDRIYIYNNIGIVYAKMGKLNKALPFFEQALAGSNRPEKTSLRLTTLNNLGIVYDKFGDNKKALYYFDEALKITKDKNLPEDFARISVSRASVIAKTDPKAAIQILSEALKVIHALNLRTLEADLYDALVEVYANTNQYKEAFETLEKLKILEDSLENIEKAKAIINLQTVHELEKSNTKLTVSETKIKNSKLVRNIIIVVAILLAGMKVVLYLLYRKTRRLNEQLSKRENELQKSNEMKDKLFSVIGHDLRGPVGNIPVMLELLDDPALTADERKYLIQSLIVHTKASTETLDKLLYWGQAQIKGIGIKPVEFNVAEPIRNNISLINITAQQKGILIANDTPPDTSVYADPAHFDFLVRNLLSNAVKFTHNGGTVTINADAKQKPGFIVFSIRDTGIGISNDRQEIIFKPFGSSTRGTADEKGTSIGLMLCKEFVNENGGDIWVSSEEGKGVTFFFALKARA